MIKTHTIIEHKIGERVYQLVCTPDSPLGELFDACNFFRGIVIEKINEAKKAQDKSNEEKWVIQESSSMKP